MSILSWILVEIWWSEDAKVQSGVSELGADGLFDSTQPLVRQRVRAPDDGQDVDSLAEAFDDPELGREQGEFGRVNSPWNL